MATTLKHLLLYIGLLGSSFVAQSQTWPNQTLSDQRLTREQIRSDFDRFRTALQEAHPAMYRYTPRARFDSLFDATAARLNRPMTRHEFYVTLTPLLVALRDGHIKWLLPGQDEHYPFFTDRLFPLKLYFQDDKAWVAGSYGADTIPPGAEVITINDQPVATVIGKLLANMTFADGTTTTGKYEDLNHFFPGYYATYVGAPTTYNVTYRTGDTTATRQLPATSYAAIKTYNEQHKSASQPAHRVVFDDSTQTAVMTIERFWTQKNEQKFKTFLAESFRQIRKKGVQHLVLDLRNNEGGEETYGVWLYQYLARQPFRYYDHISVQQKRAYSFPAWIPKVYRLFKWLVVRKRGNEYVFTKQQGLKRQSPQRDAFSGKLYILINGGSFSVTTEFAARVHADQRALFIGQETGGAYEGNNSGLFAITQLPYSKIDLGIPLFGFYMANLPAQLLTGQGIRPDYLVKPTLNDVLIGYDRAMQYTRQLIQTGESAFPKTTATNE
jgi:hypothetical protein